MVGGEVRRVRVFLRIISLTFATHAWPVWVKYGLTASLMGVILWLRIMAQPWLGAFPILFFFVGVIVAALLFDQGSGILATIIGTACAIYIGYLENIERFWAGVSIAFFVMLTLAVLIESLQEVAQQLLIRNQRMERAEQEKDVLIRESAHRIRNDLTIFSSMIRLQQARSDNQEVKDALSALNDRLLVLLRVHQRLRIAADASSAIDVKVFLQDLCDELRASLIGSQSVTLTFTSDTHWITHKAAVSLGLILNELVANALKYAYPEGRKGEVRVAFRRDEESFTLSVEDDGAGANGAIKGTGLGSKLIQAMAQQLDGVVETTTFPDRGMATVLTFSAADHAPFDAEWADEGCGKPRKADEPHGVF